jgi:hypothetical protein
VKFGEVQPKMLKLAVQQVGLSIQIANPPQGAVSDRGPEVLLMVVLWHFALRKAASADVEAGRIAPVMAQCQAILLSGQCLHLNHRHLNTAGIAIEGRQIRLSSTQPLPQVL